MDRYRKIASATLSSVQIVAACVLLANRANTLTACLILALATVGALIALRILRTRLVPPHSMMTAGQWPLLKVLYRFKM